MSFKQKEKIVKGSHKHIAKNMPKEHKGKLSYGILPKEASSTPFHQLTHLIEKEGHNHITTLSEEEIKKTDLTEDEIDKKLKEKLAKFMDISDAEPIDVDIKQHDDEEPAANA